MLNPPLSLLPTELLDLIVEHLAVLPCSLPDIHHLSLADRAFTQICQSLIFSTLHVGIDFDDSTNISISYQLEKFQRILTEKPEVADQVRVLRLLFCQEKNGWLLNDPTFIRILDIIAESPSPPHKLQFTGFCSKPIENPVLFVDVLAKSFFSQSLRSLHLSECKNLPLPLLLKSNGHPGMVCLCGRVVFNYLPSLRDGGTISFSNWQRFSTTTLLNAILAYKTFFSLVTSLRPEESREAVQLYQTRFAGFLEDVYISGSDQVLADFLTAEGVLSQPFAEEPKYHVASPLIDALITLRVIPNQFPLAPSIPVPIILDIPFILIEALKCFDKDLIRSAYSHSYKTSNVPVNGASHSQVPRESVYDTELLRILCHWLRKGGWSVTGQWHMKTPDGRHKYSDAVLSKDRNIVLEFVATANSKNLRAHIEKTPGYMSLLSANEGWVIHFTREDGFTPTWQTPDELRCGVGVIHVSHQEDFKDITLHICSKDGDKQKRDISYGLWK